MLKISASLVLTFWQKKFSKSLLGCGSTSDDVTARCCLDANSYLLAFLRSTLASLIQSSHETSRPLGQCDETPNLILEPWVCVMELIVT